LTSGDVERIFKEKLGVDVKSAKVSINPDHTSRGYGFTLFTDPSAAQRALDSKDLPFEVLPYNPKDKKDLRKAFNNIYVKNFP
jgi:RNA recognition motif-containing protein